MDQRYFDEIITDVDAGLDEMEIRRKVDGWKLEPDSNKELLTFLSDKIALRELIDVRSTDARLIIYLGYIFMALAFIFMSYIDKYAVIIFGLGFIIMRRGRRKLREARDISSIEDLVPDKHTIFHK